MMPANRVHGLEAPSDADARPELLDHATLGDLAEALGPEDFAQVIEVLLADMPPLIARLQEAVDAAEWGAAFAAAHESEGTAAALGLLQLADVMRHIANAARAEHHAPVNALLDEVRKVWTETAYGVDLLTGA